VIDWVVIVPLIEKLEIEAPDLQLLQLAKVSHENLTLKSFFFEKI
jgi:hypothetical protein